jgi:hypothetical protein
VAKGGNKRRRRTRGRGKKPASRQGVVSEAIFGGRRPPTGVLLVGQEAAALVLRAKARADEVLATGSPKQAKKALDELLLVATYLPPDALSQPLLSVLRLRLSALGPALAPEAFSLLRRLTERCLPLADQLDGLRQTLLVRYGRLDELFDEVQQIPAGNARASWRRVDGLLRQELADPAILARCEALAADHPWRLAALAASKALRAVVTGPTSHDNLETLLSPISTRSPLLPYKQLVRALAAFYREQDDRCRELLSSIAPDSAAARVVPVLSALLGDGALKNTAPRSRHALVNAMRPDSHKDGLRRLLVAFGSSMAASDDLELVEELLALADDIRTIAPEHRRQLLTRLLATCNNIGLSFHDARRLLQKELAIGDLKDDAEFYRLVALDAEGRSQPVAAIGAWVTFRKKALQEKRFVLGSPEDDALDEQLLDLMLSLSATQQAEIKCSEGALDLQQLFERVCDRENSGSERYEQWLGWAKMQKNRKRAIQAAEAWHQADPQDNRPLLFLAEAAEQRGAFKKATGYLDLAERIDDLDPELRWLRFRLAWQTTCRHLRERKPELLKEDVAMLGQLPPLEGVYHQALLDVLDLVVEYEQARASSRARKSPPSGAARGQGSALLAQRARMLGGQHPETLGGEIGVLLVLVALYGKASERASIERLLEQATPKKGTLIARTITMLRGLVSALRLVVGTPLEVALPLGWSEVIQRVLTKAKLPSQASARPDVSKVPRPGKLTTQIALPLGLEQDTRTGDANTDSETLQSDAPQVLAQVIGPDALLMLARHALAEKQPELCFAIAGYGLRRGDSALSELLYLRARSLPRWHYKRPFGLLQTAQAIARKERDTALLGDISCELQDRHQPFSSLTRLASQGFDESLQKDLIAVERQELSYPSSSEYTAKRRGYDPYQTYIAAVYDDSDDDRCDCPRCRYERGEISRAEFEAASAFFDSLGIDADDDLDDPFDDDLDDPFDRDSNLDSAARVIGKILSGQHELLDPGEAPTEETIRVLSLIELASERGAIDRSQWNDGTRLAFRRLLATFEKTGELPDPDQISRQDPAYYRELIKLLGVPDGAPPSAGGTPRPRRAKRRGKRKR